MNTPKSTSLSKRPVILDRSLQKTKNQQVSLSAFTFLFSEMIQYSQNRVGGISELEKWYKKVTQPAGIWIQSRTAILGAGQLPGEEYKAGNQDSIHIAVYQLHRVEGAFWQVCRLFGKINRQSRRVHDIRE